MAKLGRVENPRDDEESEGEEIDENDYGRWKMMKFKNFARDVLMQPAPAKKPAKATEAWAPGAHVMENHYEDPYNES
jgi:hypothetical protein